jgi:hypothetical protein
MILIGLDLNLKEIFLNLLIFIMRRMRLIIVISDEFLFDLFRFVGSSAFLELFYY